MHKNSILIILSLDISIILLSEFLIYFKPPENWWQRQFLHVQVVIIHIKITIASTSTKGGKIRHKKVELEKKTLIFFDIKKVIKSPAIPVFIRGSFS